MRRIVLDEWATPREVDAARYKAKIDRLRETLKIGDHISAIDLKDQYNEIPTTTLVQGIIKAIYRKFVVCEVKGGYTECFFYQDIRL